jgi:hypothetical protein
LDETGIRGVAFETERFARDAETVLDFGADGDPSHITPDRLEQKIVPFVSAVETDFFAVETRTDPELQSQRFGNVRKVLLASAMIHGSTTDEASAFDNVSFAAILPNAPPTI